MSSNNPQDPDNVEPTGSDIPPVAPEPPLESIGEPPPAPEPPREAAAYDAAPPPPPPGPDATPYSGQETYGAAQTGMDSLTDPSKDSRNWAMFAHLSALVVGLVGSVVGLPILSFVGPLIIYLMKKDESPFVADQALEALNFNITISIAMLVLLVLTFTIILAILTIPLMFLLGLAALVLIIVAGIKASNGEAYRYPMTLRLIK